MAAIFAGAGAVKLLRLDEFEAAVERYQLLPKRAIPLVARTVPTGEVIAGLALGIGLGTTLAATAISLLLLLFAGSVAVNLLRGRTFDCGCGTAAVSRPISWSLMTQDLILAVSALVVASAAPRAMAIDQLLFGHGNYSVRNALAAPATAALLLIGTTLVRETRTVSRRLR